MLAGGQQPTGSIGDLRRGVGFVHRSTRGFGLDLRRVFGERGIGER
jgi:hypothetical protein